MMGMARETEVPTPITDEYEERNLLAAIRIEEARLAMMEKQSPEAARCKEELRLARAKLEALYRRWPGRRGRLVVTP